MESLGELEQRGPAVGAKIWCSYVCFFCYRHSQAKNQVFRHTGATRCTDSHQTSNGRRTPGSTWLCKISPQSVQGVRMWPQN